ncbi:hypothetical protein OHC51_03430 [Stenotrophomonas indicatrix]|uniref:hypothetical protein n=1 Tax=Stenotrophomonas indicatrix TaxID=2045451 RepID=UPI00300A0458
MSERKEYWLDFDAIDIAARVLVCAVADDQLDAAERGGRSGSPKEYDQIQM